LITGILAVMIPTFIQMIIDNAIPAKNPTLLGHYVIGLVGVIILICCLWYVQVSLTARASENIFYNFKIRLSDSLLRKQLSFFSRYQSSDLLTRMVADLGLVSEFFYKYLLKSLIHFIFVSVFLIYIIFLNWKLSLIALLGIPILGIIMGALDKHITRTSTLARKRLSEQNDKVLTASIFFIFLPVVIGGYAIIRGVSGFSVGLIMAFQTYLIMLSEGINKVSIGFAESIKVTPAVKRLQELLDYAVEEHPRAANWDDIPDSTAIEFKQVSFGYMKNKLILANFNLHVNPGEKVCIMGQSGSGKTTVTNLLLRFLSPDTGEITFGDSNIQKYLLNTYLSHFSYVWQDTYLFKLSVKENVTFGWHSVPDDMVHEVIARVGLKDAVESLSEQYETIIGKDGINFSGGQRQRLALARALIRGPEILILDEFTSALDSKLEQKMLDDIFALFKNQTIICITHSELVARRFDRIVRL